MRQGQSKFGVVDDRRCSERLPQVNVLLGKLHGWLEVIQVGTEHRASLMGLSYACCRNILCQPIVSNMACCIVVEHIVEDLAALD